MPTPIMMPKAGNSVESCVILKWHKQAGDAVKDGEIVLDVETDKAVVQVESPTAGTLLTQFFAVGQEVPVLTCVGVIGIAGEDVEPFRPSILRPAVVNVVAPPPVVTVAPTTPAPMLEASPRARSLADQHGILLKDVQPTGPNGRIIERDVQRALADQQTRLTRLAREQAQQEHVSVPAVGSGLGGRVTSADLQITQPIAPDVMVVPELDVTPTPDGITIPLQGVRKMIAERMRQSLQNSAQLTLNASANATALLALRRRFKGSAPTLGMQDITLNDLLLFVVARVLLNYPALNATLHDHTITQYQRVHLGFAVDTPRGLLVPIIKDAHQRSLRQISQETQRLVASIEANKITPSELQGGTFTVSNLGALGIESFTPILNPPQVAILGVGKVDLKPVQGDGQVEFLPHLALSLTVDHQAVDGAPAARFLQALTQALTDVDLWLAL